MEQVTDLTTVGRWLAGYEAAWRPPGTEILAVDGPTAVVRAEVRYGDPA
jgi:hypothetical protein